MGSLWECPTLSDPGDCGLPGFSVREQGSPGKNTGACWSILVSMAVWHWSGPEEIPHVQGQRSPSKTVRTGVASAWHWSGSEEITHIQGQRRSPSKMVGRAKLHLESNPIPTRDTLRAQTNLVHTKTQRPHRD